MTKLIEFLKHEFDAHEIECLHLRDGTIISADVRIHDSALKMSTSIGEFEAMPASIYPYVEDADMTYRRALQAGAISIMEPFDHFNGDREVGVKDPTGQLWWIATHKLDLSPEQRQTGLEAFLRQIGEI